MESRNKTVIIDVDPSDLVIDGRKSSSETDKMGVFARKTFTYGVKSAINFIGWSIKETLKLVISGFKMAAEGNREMNDELRKNRPRRSSKRQISYVPAFEEDDVETGVSLRRYGR